MTYAFMFRCRYCKEEFREAETGNEQLAFKCLVYAISGKRTPEHAQAPELISAHFTDDHMGVADFIGVKKVNDGIEKELKGGAKS